MAVAAVGAMLGPPPTWRILSSLREATSPGHGRYFTLSGMTPILHRTIALTSQLCRSICHGICHKPQNCRNLRLESAECMVAATARVLPSASIVGDGRMGVEQLVAGFDQQKIPLGARDFRHRQRAKFVEMPRRQFVFVAGVRILLRTKIRRKIGMRPDRRIDQNRLTTEAFSEISCIESAERTAHQRECTFGLRARSVPRRRLSPPPADAASGGRQKSGRDGMGNAATARASCRPLIDAGELLKPCR